MILSYRKRATSPSADCQIIPNPGIRVQARAAAEDSAQVLQIKNETPSTVGVQARASPSKARRNTPFASFFQNLFVANTSSNANANGGPTGGSSTQEWDPSSRKDEPGCSSKNRSEGRDQDTDARRDSSYHNEAYVFSSPSPSCSSSAESINTVLSTNSFAFVHPKKYGGKKRHGKRIPIDIDGDESPREPVPVKLKVQHAQPLPNSRRKKLSTLSRLGMKIGLKSKYNLQSCESLQSATAAGSRSGSIRRANEKGYVEGGHDGKDKDTGRGQSSKRRAPLPPSASAHGHRQAGSSRNLRLPPAPSASAVLHNYNNHTHNHHESVQLKSVTSLGSFDRLPPTPKSKPTSGSDHSGPISNSPAVQSQTQQPQHRRYHSDGHHGHAHAHGHVAGGSRSSASAARVYHHVRGKRKAPVPPVRLTTVTVTKTVASEDERIIQSILNVKPPAAAATLPVAADEAKGNIGASSPTAACRYPWRNQNSNSSRLRLGLGCSPNMATTATATPAAGPRQQQQLESLEESSLHSPKTNTRTRTIDDAASASQTHSQAQPRKSAITATLGCYESFEEDDDDDEHGHLSTNSLLVREKRQNEQVRSQLTKANGLSNNGVNCASPSSTSSAVPALPSTSKTTTTSTSKMSFSFFRRNTDKENGRAQHATAASSTVPTTHSQASNSNAVSQNQIAETNPTTTPSLAGVTVVKLAPRPWYKRSSKDKANTTGCVTTGAGSVTPNRAKPSISVLTNISELDRQAAEIVEEKRRRSAIEQNESAKKLISMFNRAFSAQSPSSSKDQDLSPSSSSAQSTNSNYANAVTLPSGAGSSGAGPPSGGLDERKKLAIVQPQANTNYKAQTRPVSIPTTPSMLVGNSILGPRPPGILGAETSASSSTADWSCPRCTLQNAHWRSFCDACHFRQGSTLVHSIASMFEASGQNQTPERRGSGTERSSTTSRPPAEDQAAGQSVAIATAAQSATTTCSTSQTTNANTTAPGSSMELPPENLLCHTKDKSEKDKKLDGIKLHADDPEVEELDLEKLREARLAFFARHKVSSPPTATATASSFTSTNTKLSSGSQKSAVVDNLKKKPSKFPVTICNSNDLNQFLPRDRADADPERQRENDSSGSAEESEEDYPASTAFSTPKWKPFSPQKKTYLDPTYENWHLKLSELDIDGDGDDTVAVTANFNQSTRNSAFIRNISSEIKDQLDYFDRLKSQLRRQRSPGDGLDDSEFSESDASTVIDAANFDVIMENRRLRQLQLEERRGPQLHFGAATDSSSASARRRISLGDPIPNSNSPPSSSRPFLHRNGAGPTTAPVSSSGHSSYRSFERRDHDDRHRFQEFRENESRPRSHSHQPQPAFYHRNGVQAQVQASGSERRQQNRALEHSASAISKQLRKLEWAINVGDHKLAASLAHDLAILKASCNKVPEERTSQPHPITIRVYVEDRFMQQGPFQVPVTAATTVHELKSKIERDWGIPVLFQKWILGRKIAEDEGQTLAAYEVVHDSMAFLYLVTPNNGKSQEKDGGSSSSEDSVQIMAITHLAKSPPVSRKISPEVAIASKDDRGTKEVAAGSASCTLSEPDKSSTSLEVKHESASAKTAQNLPKAELEPPSTSQMVSAPSGGNNSQQETTTTASVGVPKSNKTVTSKYIESIRQTNSEEPPLSPENSILKQNIHGEKVGKAKQVPVTSPQQPPLSPSTRRKLTQKDTTKDQVRRSAVRVERLLETSTELSRKANSQAIQRQQQPIQTAATGGAKNVGAELPETSSEETRRERAKANEIRHTKPNFSPVLKHELPTLNPKTGTGTASMPSVEVQAVVVPLSSFNEKPLVGQSQRKAATQGRVEPVQAAPVIRPLVKSPGAEFAPKHSNGAPHIQVQGPLNKDPEPQSPEQVNNADGKSKSRNRWNPQPQASSSKNVEVLDQILIRRKDSDAIDINLQVQETAAKSVGSSLSSPSGTAAAGGATIPDKEDNTETYRKMLQLMENEDCVRNTEELDCPVCFSRVGVGDGVTLRDCLHCFCRECLAGTIQYSDEPQVKCPFRDASYSCESFLQEREIKGLVSPTMFERHLAQAVKLAENKIANTFHCKTNDCTGWCIFEDDVNVFKCPVCRKSNCLTCQAIHEGKNCQEYQRELAINAETDEGAKSSRIMLEKMIQRGEALECPACHVVLLKKWGCDWVRCSYCKTEICWVTKSFRWGKNGKGDTSGGCRCGVNGVKCHPKCTYCH